MSREVHAPFCERPEVRFLRPTLLIAINERQVRRVVRSYVDYYHQDRTHLGLEKDTPEERPIEMRGNGKVVAIPRVGGLQHRYSSELLRAA